MIQRVRRKLLYSKSNRRVIRWSQRIVLPGFEGFSLYHISRFFFMALQQGQLVTRASAIAFKLFLAFFPAIIMLLTLIPFIPIADFQLKLMENFQAMMPREVYAFIEGLLHDLLVKKHSTLLSVSTITGIYFASNSMDAILDGFSSSYHMTRWHSAFKQRLLSLGLLVALTIMMVTAMALLSLSNWAISLINDSGYVLSQLEHYGLLAAKWGITLLMMLTSISMLYNAGDPTARRFKFFTPGAILAVLLTMLVSQALVFFFERITDYNALYGSIGAIIAVQLWLYFNMIVLLIGFELNSSITKARLDRSESLRPKGVRP
ncbi:MAG: YihY/virulence factor BrkB family protein [Flavobacteriales bacterium]|nr:YihY/virulence factor BrkB family protein [Flavobacteriales bacterium]MBK9286302.1 YihY/virulence factor BrkB family protein [Flavobacteriales bacterium]MBL0034671.1 YihY/virulence factor BrkB family protein [Flavobacteriales bacterium]